MDLSDRRNPFNNLVLPPPPPPSTYPIFPRTSSSSATNFPILAVAVIGILATAFLLVTYYIFVIKCCLNWHQIDIFRRRRRSSTDQNPLMIYSPHEVNKGLEESVIRAIPIFKFKKRQEEEEGEDQNKSSQECSVCLNEFQEDEKLKIIPNCCHVFHIDCIDIWLQGNANCPLCRSSVSCDESFPLNLMENSPSSRNRNLEPEIVIGGDEDFVVIELGTSNGNNRESVRDRDFLREQERVAMDEVLTRNTAKSISSSPRTLDHRGTMYKKEIKFSKVMSKGDECINTRGKDDHFGDIQPIRRSISMDSSADRKLYLAVQEAIGLRKGLILVDKDGGGCVEDSSGSGNNRVMKRCFLWPKS